MSNQPTPSQCSHLLFSALQNGHSAQSFSSMALELTPGQRLLSYILPQFPLARPMLYPTFRHTVQKVTGFCLFAIYRRCYAFTISDSTISASMALLEFT